MATEANIYGSTTAATGSTRAHLTPSDPAFKIRMNDSQDNSISSSGLSAFEVVNGAGSPPCFPYNEDVAIIGMSCRTAGGNDTPEKLWKFLLEKKDACGEVPKKRWEPWLRRDPRNAKIIEKTISKGYFIENLENFDASFFGISPKEAEMMDPHQRLALELSWEALESAGLDPKALAGSNTAVYLGVDNDDYSRLLLEDMPNIEAWSGIGTAYHGAPNRVSYHLDLRGPSAAIGAACASSLIALHLGRQAILSGESNVAIVGGVNVLCAPALTYMLEKAGALSPDGACLSFDDDAHGYARGEGGAIIILKKLSAALVENDNILALLKGSATAQDGKTNGIMAPNDKAQESAARQALACAGVDPLTVGYVEAHATSTSLGDPTEVGAISNIYGVGRLADAPCAIGSIKPNVGHLEAAAGAIGLVKAVMAVEKAQLAPQTRLQKLNTQVDWENSGLKVVRDVSAWPKWNAVRRAAVCSYGYGGSVAHAIIEQAPSRNSTTDVADRENSDKSATTLVLSAPQEKRLISQATALAAWLSTDGQKESIHSIARTLGQRRAHHNYRAAFVMNSHEEAINSLRSFVQGGMSNGVYSNRIFDNNKGVVWVFSGHGAQWPDMGKALLKNPVFFEALLSLDESVEKEAGFSALKVLKDGDVGDSCRVQVLTYIVQIGLSQVLKSKGMEPQAIFGHSVGEIAASVVADCLTPYEGLLVVARRAKLYAQVKGLGAMALVRLSFSQAKAELADRRNIIAAIDSSPSSCVISGEVAALNDYISSLRSRSIGVFRVKTDIAFHSPMLEKLKKPLVDSLARDLDPRPAKTILYSTSSANARSSALRDADFWTNNMTSPVLLQSAVSAAVEDAFRIFLEVSTHPIVAISIEEILAEQRLVETAVIGTMKQNQCAETTITHGLAQLFTLGASINFKAQQGSSPWSPKIPGTVWAHKPYWKEVETGVMSTSLQHDANKHTLLGQYIDIAGTETRLFTTTLNDRNKPYPGSHPLDGTEIIPAAVYCNTFHHATGATVLSHLQMRVPVAMATDLRDIQVVVQGDVVRMVSRLQCSDQPRDEMRRPWTDHATCKWYKSARDMAQQSFNITCIKERIGTLLPNSFAWDYLQQLGVSGLAFSWGVMEHYGNSKEMIVKVDMDPTSTAMDWDARSWAPLLDAATSVGSSIFFNHPPEMRIVSQIDNVFLLSTHPLPRIGYLFIEDATDENNLAADISILSEEGLLLAKLQSMRLSKVVADSSHASGINGLAHRMAWIPPRFSEKPLTLSEIMLVSEDTAKMERYANELGPLVTTLIRGNSFQELSNPDVQAQLDKKGAIVVYFPGDVESFEEISKAAHSFVWETVSILKALARYRTTPKLLVVTDCIYKAQTPSALAQGPLYGLARIAAQEYPDSWGGLIDNEGPNFPLMAMKYVQNQDVLRVDDGLPRIARLRPFSREQRHPPDSTKTLLPKPEGTYIITGGHGNLGLEICDFLVEKGARRIVLISRHALPHRSKWSELSPTMQTVVGRVKQWEKQGATIHSIAVDVGGPDASRLLLQRLDMLSLPPVLGVVHAAGVLEDNLIRDTTPDSFARVFNPKVLGALALHEAFPPRTLDFFILFSSIGQLVGIAGQSTYGASNAFLDVLATHRRNKGDNTVAFQWSAWRGLGMATATEYLTMELQNRGVTDITAEEAFRAWEYVAQFDTEHAVVTRVRTLEVDEPAFPLVEEIAVRRTKASGTTAPDSNTGSEDANARPADPTKLRDWLSIKIRECIGAVLMIPDIEEIDVRAAVTDMGVDSVVTVSLRQKLQSVLKVKVPPTLTWDHPTVGLLVEWFAGRLVEVN